MGTQGEFACEYMPTIGIHFRLKNIEVNGRTVKVQIWDTAGQERFRTITQNYYRGAHGIVLVCSVDDNKSKKNIKRWLDDVRKIIRGENFNAILVINKCDLIKEDTPEMEAIMNEAEDLSSELGLECIVASAKQNIRVNEVFERLIEMVYDRLYKSKKPTPVNPGNAAMYRDSDHPTRCCSII